MRKDPQHGIINCCSSTAYGNSNTGSERGRRHLRRISETGKVTEPSSEQSLALKGGNGIHKQEGSQHDSTNNEEQSCFSDRMESKKGHHCPTLETKTQSDVAM